MLEDSARVGSARRKRFGRAVPAFFHHNDDVVHKRFEVVHAAELDDAVFACEHVACRGVNIGSDDRIAVSAVEIERENVAHDFDLSINFVNFVDGDVEITDFVEYADHRGSEVIVKVFIDSRTISLVSFKRGFIFRHSFLICRQIFCRGIITGSSGFNGFIDGSLAAFRLCDQVQHISCRKEVEVHIDGHLIILLIAADGYRIVTIGHFGVAGKGCIEIEVEHVDCVCCIPDIAADCHNVGERIRGIVRNSGVEHKGEFHIDGVNRLGKITEQIGKSLDLLPLEDIAGILGNITVDGAFIEPRESLDGLCERSIVRKTCNRLAVNKTGNGFNHSGKLFQNIGDVNVQNIRPVSVYTLFGIIKQIES